MNLAAHWVTFGDIAFGDLKPSHIQAWTKAMQNKPLAASTIRTGFTNGRGGHGSVSLTLNTYGHLRPDATGLARLRGISIANGCGPTAYPGHLSRN